MVKTKRKLNEVWQSEKYYRIAAEGSRDISHPAMVVLKTLADRSKNILDLGCGEGSRLNYLAPNKGVGIDISKKAISLAKKKYPRHHFLVGNLNKLPFNTEKFDLIYSAFVFEHIDKPERVVGQAIKYLANGGKLVIIAPNYGAPNRASPPFKGSRLFKLIGGLIRDFSPSSTLSWKKIDPLGDSKHYEIDWDTTIEPYLGSLLRYLKSQGLRVFYATSCWSEEMPAANRLQKAIRFLGERNIYPFSMWGPHLLVVAEKRGESQKCVYCGGKNYRELFKIDYSVIKICNNCGLIKTKGLIIENYEAYHRDKDYQKYEAHFENLFEKIVSDISKGVKEKGRVLEIGCSTGVLLDLFKKDGWEVWGVEPSGAADIARKREMKILKTTLNKAELPNNYFDLVILNHSLEHMENPKEALRVSHQILKKGGKIFIGVPNAGSLSANLLGKHWSMLLPKEHRFYFSPKVLEKILVSLGFQIVFNRTRSGIFNLERPLGGLFAELKDRPKNFIIDFLTLPTDFLATALNRGTNLSIIGKKIT